MVISEREGVRARSDELSKRMERSARVIERSRVRRASAARRLELTREHLAAISERRTRLAAQLAQASIDAPPDADRRLTTSASGAD